MKAKKILGLITALSLIPAAGIFPAAPHAAAAGDSAVTVRLDPSNASPFNNGEFEGWGTSLCWWANRLGYSEKLTKAAADAFFSDEGLGLDIARYNLGGGDDPAHNHITRSDSKVPGVWSEFTMSEDGKDVSITKYDLSKDQNQLNIAKAALKANPKLYFEGFSNSAPYFMTITGCTSGGDPASSDNLKPDMYDDFGKFIADATALFKAEGIEFKSYSPMNEPDTDYWGVNSFKQEGCHFDPGESQSKAIIETRKALDAKGLTDVIVAGMDETDLGKTVKNYPQLSDEAKAALGRIDTHTYSGSDRAGVKRTAINASKTLWMSEVDKGGNGFVLADMIILDMNGMQPAAWVMWDIIDKHKDADFKAPDGSTPEKNAVTNYNDSLWGVGMADHDTEELVLTQKYYAFGQFTRYIEPGDTIIASSGSTLAAYNKKTGDIKIVANNSSASDKPCVFDLSAFTNVGSTVNEIRTNNNGTEKWAEITGEASLNDKKLSTTLKAQTITTYVVKGSNAPVNYAIITGGSDKISLGASVNLTLKTDLAAPGTVTWKVSDSSVASVTADGIVTALAPGKFTVTASGSGFTASRDFEIPMYKLSGTASWGNASTAPSDSADYTHVDDGDFNTYFDGVTGGWVMYDYGAPYKLTSVKLAARSGNGMADRTKGGKVQGSNDAITWTDLYTLSSAIPAGEYTTITADKLLNSTAYRYYRYINSDDMANIAEFVLDGTIHTAAQANEPSITDLAEFTDDFEGSTNIFAAESGDFSADGNTIYTSPLSRFGNVFIPVRATGRSELAKAVTLTGSNRFRLTFDMFAGWENGGKENSFAIKSEDGTELIKAVISGGGYNLHQMWIGGKDVLADVSDKPVVQCKSTPAKGANGWDHSSQPYANTVGYNKSVKIIIDGTGAVSVKLSGGTSDLEYTGTVTTPINIKSIELTGDCNTSRGRVVSYDNLDGDVITYSSELPTPPPATPTPKPTSAPVIPANGELINMNFDNGDLTSTSIYGKAEGTPKFVTVDGRKCIQFDGTAATAVNLFDANGNSLLSGQKELTVSFKVKPTSSATSWWFFAAPNAGAQTYQKEQYLGAMTNGGTLTVERYNNSGSRSQAATGAYTPNEWNDVMISFDDGITTVYINGKKAGSADSTVDIASMLGNKSVAYIGLANWGSGEYATGYIDDFVIYNKVLGGLDIDLGDLSAVKSDITLPTALADGTAISWTTSDTSVIAADGKVTRPLLSTDITLTASAVIDGRTLTQTFTARVIGRAAAAESFTAYTENGAVKYTSGYESGDKYTMYVAVHDSGGILKAVKINTAEAAFEGLENETYSVSCYLWEGAVPVIKPVSKTVKLKEEKEMGAYLFAHFIGSEKAASDEQIYFSVSKDGTNWTTVNGIKPVLTSNVGEKGVRDPYILRGEDGKFFVIATDLSIYERRDDSNRWGTCQTSGSKSIVIWESTDLVNWSEARLVKVAVDNAGCTWAPEAVYDSAKDMYMVFWASKTSADNYSTQRMYRSYTKDFVTFSDPEIYIDGGNISNIDTTILEEKGVYYRFTKNESKSSVTMMRSTSLDSGWTDVTTYTINGTPGNTVTGYEGPTIYKMNGENKWCLLLDYYSKSQGYKPFVTDDITKGEFTSASDFKFDTTYRHGTVMPITDEEYNAIVKAYPNE